MMRVNSVLLAQSMILILDYNMSKIKFNETMLMNLKFAMVKRYGDINYSRLAKEIGKTRQSVYMAIRNFDGFDETRKLLINWIAQ